jgi:hypothetical protein
MTESSFTHSKESESNRQTIPKQLECETRATPSSFIARGLPNVLVIAVLIAIAYWGHRTGWKAPKFSDVFGAHTKHEKEDWCIEHAVPESKCIKCHPELAGESAVDWCKEHGVSESRCTICHPEILTKGVAGDW